jgi:hypothetical protein
MLQFCEKYITRRKSLDNCAKKIDTNIRKFL